MSQVSTITSTSVRSMPSAKIIRARRIAGMLKSTVASIPCLIEIDSCTVVKGSYDRSCDSDWDYYGYSEVEFTVYDRNGYAAKWLEKKMSDSDKERIEQEIIASYKD